MGNSFVYDCGKAAAGAGDRAGRLARAEAPRVLLVFLDVSSGALIGFAVPGLRCGAWGPFFVF